VKQTGTRVRGAARRVNIQATVRRANWSSRRAPALGGRAFAQPRGQPERRGQPSYHRNWRATSWSTPPPCPRSGRTVLIQPTHHRPQFECRPTATGRPPARGGLARAHPPLPHRPAVAATPPRPLSARSRYNRKSSAPGGGTRFDRSSSPVGSRFDFLAGGACRALRPPRQGQFELAREA